MERPAYTLEEREVILVLRGKLSSIAEILRTLGRAPLPLRAAIHNLEGRGILEIHRIASPEEDRSAVKLTPEGDELAEQFHAAMIANGYRDGASEMTEAKRKALGALSANGQRFLVEALKAASDDGNRFHARNVGKAVGFSKVESVQMVRRFADHGVVIPNIHGDMQTFTPFGLELARERAANEETRMANEAAPALQAGPTPARIEPTFTEEQIAEEQTLNAYRKLKLAVPQKKLLVALVNASEIGGEARKLYRPKFINPEGWTSKHTDKVLYELASIAPLPNRDQLVRIQLDDVFLSVDAVTLAKSYDEQPPLTDLAAAVRRFSPASHLPSHGVIIKSDLIDDEQDPTMTADQQRFFLACYQRRSNNQVFWGQIARDLRLSDGDLIPLVRELTQRDYWQNVGGRDVSFRPKGEQLAQKLGGYLKDDFRIDKTKPTDPPGTASRVQPPTPQIQSVPASRAVEDLRALLTPRQEQFLLACYAAFETDQGFINPVRAGVNNGFSELESRDIWQLLTNRQPPLLTIAAVGRELRECAGVITTEGREMAREIKHFVDRGAIQPDQRKPTMTDDANAEKNKDWAKWLYQIVKEGRNTSVGKLAYGLLLLGAAAAFIALIFRYDFKYAFFSMLAIVPLAGVVLALSWAKEHGKKDARPFYLTFLIICLTAFAIIVFLSISVTFFGIPEVGAKRIFGQ